MRYPTPLFPIIVAKLFGGSVTAAAVLSAMEAMSDAQAAAALDALDGASKADISTVFHFKGDKATIADLPATGNSVGDIWYVEAEQGLFVWLVDEAHPDGFWDEFGQPINLSAYELKPTTVTEAGSSVTIANAANNTIYSCGELSSLTVTAIANPGSFIIQFTSGATPTTTSFPASMVFPAAFAAEANTRYEINVRDGYALVCGWPTA